MTMDRRQFLKGGAVFLASLYGASYLPGCADNESLPVPNIAMRNRQTIESYISRVKEGDHPFVRVVEERAPDGTFLSKGVVFAHIDDVNINLILKNDGQFIVDYSRGNNDLTTQHHIWSAQGPATPAIYELNGVQVTDPAKINELYEQSLEFIVNSLPQ